MIGKQVLDSRVVSLSEAKTMLQKREKETGSEELVYEQKTALEHLQKYCKFSLKKSKEVYEKLEKLDLDPEMIIKVVDFLPEDLSDVRLLFGKTRKLPEEKMKKVVEAVKPFLAK